MDFVKKTQIEIKLLTTAIGVLAIYCAVHSGVFP